MSHPRPTPFTRDLVATLAATLATLERTDPRRMPQITRLASAFLRGAGYADDGSPLASAAHDDVRGVGWLGVRPDLRALAEEHGTPRQVEAMRHAADGHGTREIGRRMGIDGAGAQRHLERAGRRIEKWTTHCPKGEGEYEATAHGGVGHDESTETPIICGPRSPESDPVRVRHVPFFPARERPELYWAMPPRDARDMARRPATVRGSDVSRMPPVDDYYPEPGLEDIDRRAVLLTRVGDRPIVTVQGDGETTGAFAARHRRRVNAWQGIPTKGSTSTRLAVSATPSRRLLPNVH